MKLLDSLNATIPLIGNSQDKSNSPLVSVIPLNIPNAVGNYYQINVGNANTQNQSVSQGNSLSNGANNVDSGSSQNKSGQLIGVNVQTSLPINPQSGSNLTFVVENNADGSNLALTPASKQDNINLTKINLTLNTSNVDLKLIPIQKEANTNLTINQ